MAQPGDTIGPYVIDALIAEGGMGAVYRARNRVTGQMRALKIVKEDLAKKGDFVDRFVREATIASQVRHPYLVETLEPGIDRDTIYLPMELLEGETLHARIRRQKRMNPAEMAAILGQVSEAMQALHDRGLVHRDLKPMNVFLCRTPRGEVAKVLDFGTARDLEDDEHTKTGMVVGSPYYMAPEQAEGRRDIDARADQYALGVIAYQLITGHRPYESDDTRSALAKLLRGEPFLSPKRYYAEVSDELEGVIVRALDRERDRRFARIADLGAALVRAAQNSPALPMGAQGATSSSSGGVLASSSEIRMRGPDPEKAATALLAAPPPTGVSAHFTPPPGSMPPASSGPRSYVVVGAAVAALAVLGTVSAFLAWQLAPPEVTSTELAPRIRHLPVTAPAATSVPATPIVGTSAPVVGSGTTPTPTALPPSAPTVAGPAPSPETVPATTPPLAAEGDSTEHVTDREGRTGRTGRSRRTGTTTASGTSTPITIGSGATTGRGSESSSGGGDAPHEEDEPCGAATGIPCLD